MHDGSHGEGCFGCKAKSIQISPKATPSRRSVAPPRESNNSYEAGIPRDSRGMPWLDTSTLEPLGQKDVDQRRRLIHDNEERHKVAPSTLT